MFEQLKYAHLSPEILVLNKFPKILQADIQIQKTKYRTDFCCVSKGSKEQSPYQEKTMPFKINQKLYSSVLLLL